MSKSSLLSLEKDVKTAVYPCRGLPQTKKEFVTKGNSLDRCSFKAFFICQQARENCLQKWPDQANYKTMASFPQLWPCIRFSVWHHSTFRSYIFDVTVTDFFWGNTLSHSPTPFYLLEFSMLTCIGNVDSKVLPSPLETVSHFDCDLWYKLTVKGMCKQTEITSKLHALVSNVL